MGRLQANRPFLDVPLANAHAYSHSRNLSAVSPLYLTSRDESTRVQLQKERLKREHAIIVSHRIPGFKTSAGM